MNTRRKLLIALGASALTAPLPSFAQSQSRIPRIGFLNPAAPDSRALPRLRAFQEGLRELGYVEGKTIVIEVRWAEGKLGLLPALAAELVRLNVDVIVTGTSPATYAAQSATRTIPIVMATSSDPVGDGHVASLARPGGNITGLSSMAPELGAKRIQLLKEVFPNVSHTLAVLWNPAYTGMQARFEQAKVAAPKLGLNVRSLEVRDARELEEAFEAMGRERPDALVLLADPFTGSQRQRIVEFAAAKQLPAIYETSDFAEAGGLMSYGPNQPEQYRRAATYVDKILKGAKPAELPIEQPTKFEFVINLKTAKTLGIRIPNSILVQVTKVIE